MKKQIQIPALFEHIDSIDISEQDIWDYNPDILKKLLIDHTMSAKARKQANDLSLNVNIFWATNDYDKYGEGYHYFDQIVPEAITGTGRERIVMPRVLKDTQLKLDRIKDKAEVFTPSWVCNIQNNLVDEAWFGRQNVFNTEVTSEDGSHSWITNEDKIEFPDDPQKSWKNYVRERRLEITCGEAPYLVSRYDTTTGVFIPLEQRIGILDRKLRVIHENASNDKEWREETRHAYESTYGFEWQGDNLLLAREALLLTYIENYYKHFKSYKSIERSLPGIAYIISWNIWQMDGLKMVIPNSCENVYETNLFGESNQSTCPACEKGELHGHIGIPCIIRNWKKPREQQKIQFSSLISNI